MNHSTTTSGPALTKDELETSSAPVCPAVSTRNGSLPQLYSLQGYVVSNSTGQTGNTCNYSQSAVKTASLCPAAYYQPE